MVKRFTTAIATLAALATLTAPTAEAAPRQARPAAPTEAVAPREAGEPIMAIVSIKSQQVTLYDADGWILRAPVSTGTTGRETPAGVFAVLERNKEHRSNMYDDASMPNMQRITWNAPASLLEKLIRYEAVHEIRSWNDLRNRLDSDRRLYAFFHPRMPQEPLIFVEVALTKELSSNIQELLDEHAPVVLGAFRDFGRQLLTVSEPRFELLDRDGLFAALDMVLDP